ncbi:SDR family NAD(P)-dependent oxidoreductase [Mycobacterium sp. NPDC051804]|uniref:SDR family NAD(P)-dependent oxidoreductase n=1 Tax=Mycobacterium sp. NPDC051804 TaxID=3364295 RepID=UPI0037AD2C9A
MTGDDSVGLSGSPDGVPRIDDWNRLLDGRVAVITGGGDGIGAGIARLFALHGALVEVAEVDRERADRIRDEVTSVGGSIRCHVVDVTADADVALFADAVLSEHGRADVLVNNVGDYRPLVPFHHSTPKSWQQQYDINLRHVFTVTRAFVPSMMNAHRGSIVTVHSVEGMRGYPKDPVYGAMKAAAAHFTTCLAVDLGRHGIRVNGIGTDLAQTPQVDYLTGYEDVDELWASWAPVGRVGLPEDQARVALFLASDQSAFVTGHNIPVDGGTKAGGGWLFSPREGRFVNRSRNL